MNCQYYSNQEKALWCNEIHLFGRKGPKGKSRLPSVFPVQNKEIPNVPTSGITKEPATTNTKNRPNNGTSATTEPATTTTPKRPINGKTSTSLTTSSVIVTKTAVPEVILPTVETEIPSGGSTSSKEGVNIPSETSIIPINKPLLFIIPSVLLLVFLSAIVFVFIEKRSNRSARSHSSDVEEGKESEEEKRELGRRDSVNIKFPSYNFRTLTNSLKVALKHYIPRSSVGTNSAFPKSILTDLKEERFSNDLARIIPSKKSEPVLLNPFYESMYSNLDPESKNLDSIKRGEHPFDFIYEDEKHEGDHYEDKNYEDYKYEGGQFEEERYEDDHYEGEYDDDNSIYSNHAPPSRESSNLRDEDPFEDDSEYEDEKYKGGQFEEERYEDDHYDDEIDEILNKL
jgi:hypothetical protein